MQTVIPDAAAAQVLTAIANRAAPDQLVLTEMSLKSAINIQMIITGAPHRSHATRTPMLVAFRFPLDRLMPTTQPTQTLDIKRAERVSL